MLYPEGNAQTSNSGKGTLPLDRKQPADGRWGRAGGEWEMDRFYFSPDIFNYFVHFHKAEIGLNAGGKIP